MNAIDIVSPIDHRGLSECEVEILTKAVLEIRELRRKSFEESLDRASRTTASWPEWKRNCLGKINS